MNDHPDGFGPDRVLLAAGAVLGVAAAVAAVLRTEPTDRVVLAALAVVLLGLVVAGLRIGRRLTVDADGLVVRGPTSVRAVPWADVLFVSAPSRRRMGIASTTLEIELVDDELLLFGRLDLGVDPERAADAIRARRPGPRPGDRNG